ncbi:hypothetical protein CBOM_07403 [Ceraceosorus bombacis]|uniref:Uncharacterized protein n=1 Tax=Ceraceosorus bombacis TaxID=401625 RepID=A0A0P1BAQ4_9BASI|nr:hypothetical protein CBOM_07403 [Ceraceosorus bombacis]
MQLQLRNLLDGTQEGRGGAGSINEWRPKHTLYAAQHLSSIKGPSLFSLDLFSPSSLPTRPKRLVLVRT